MLASNGYATKSALKKAIGEPLQYEETSLYGTEYTSTGTLTMVGPSAYNRKWYAQITMENGKIKSVK
jgi:hypothetical protein